MAYREKTLDICAFFILHDCYILYKQEISKEIILEASNIRKPIPTLF